MKTFAHKLTDNLNTILVVAAIALAIVAVFKVDSWGSGSGPTIVEGTGEDGAG